MTRRVIRLVVVALLTGCALLVLHRVGTAVLARFAGPAPLVIDEALAARSAVPPSLEAGCRKCHVRAYDLWRTSQHALANRLGVSCKAPGKAFDSRQNAGTRA